MSTEVEKRDFDTACSTISASIVTGRAGQKFGTIKDIADACRTLDIDLGRMQTIHIAGTKGKGSTAAFSERLLRESGNELDMGTASNQLKQGRCRVRTGLFTSPHLVDVRERMRINGKVLGKEQFSQYFWDMHTALSKSGPQDLHFFHLLTTLAFYIFQKEEVEVAVVEVGLGGELDATNVLPAPVVCGVTLLDLDHVNVLGSTLPEIATAKAGIFKPGIPAVSISTQRPEAMAVLAHTAKTVECPFFVAPDVAQYAAEGVGGAASVSQLGLDGEFQWHNAALALALTRVWRARTARLRTETEVDRTVACAEAMQRAGVEPWTPADAGSAFEGRAADTAAVAKNLDAVSPSPSLLPSPSSALASFEAAALSNTSWPGRAQVLLGALPSTTVFLDGAHTASSLSCCGEWFKTRTLAPPAHGPAPWLRALIFNTTGGRSETELLAPLVALQRHSGEGPARALFDVVLFVPNDSSQDALKKTAGGAAGGREGYEWQYTLLEAWETTAKKEGRGAGPGGGDEELPMEREPIQECATTAVAEGRQRARVACSIEAALQGLAAAAASAGKPAHVLCAGSLYLVGDVLGRLQEHPSLDL